MIKNLIRTRFAPSPTGELHIGGARTALFCYLWAKKNQGQFIFRVEDTDQARNQEVFVKNQYKDLCWLGLKPDESPFQEPYIDITATIICNEHYYDPYRQSERLDIYRRYIDRLIQEKKAYYCFCSREELVREKEAYIKKNQRGNYQYSRKCLNLTEPQIKLFLQNQKSYLIRFQVNRKKSYEFSDLVRGKVIFQGCDIEDFIIFRSNGIPTYHLAVVIDDYLMKIGHVLRAEEHLSNTGKQLVLYEAFGWNPPLFGHISLILNKEKKKLSKRDQVTSQFQLISQLREKGYLPSALVNYLLFLGWHPGEGITQEIFSLKEAVKVFNLAGLHAKGAVYDLEKLNWYNNYYIQQLTEKEFSEYAWQFLVLKYNLGFEKKEWVKQVAWLFRSQLNCFQELIDLTRYFFQKPNWKVEIKGKEALWLAELSQELNQLDDWEVEKIKSVLKSVCLNNQAPKKEFYLLVRNVLTGTDKGPELPHIIYSLGKGEVEKRFKIII